VFDRVVTKFIIETIVKQLSLFFMIGLVLLSAPLVRAETTRPLTDQYIEAIRLGCSNALQSMRQIQRVEAVTRVNRGQEYEGMLKLVSALNSRIVLNKQDAPRLTSAASQMQTTFTKFQRDYLEYAEKFDTAQRINCREAPVSFYDALNDMREARAVVATDVTTFSELLDEYQASFNEFRGLVPEASSQSRAEELDP